MEDKEFRSVNIAIQICYCIFWRFTVELGGYLITHQTGNEYVGFVNVNYYTSSMIGLIPHRTCMHPRTLNKSLVSHHPASGPPNSGDAVRPPLLSRVTFKADSLTDLVWPM